MQLRSTQRGFTLFESLISVVILSVGMLGIAALYVEGLKASRTAVFRTTAVSLAADMMDRIRANPLARDDYGLGASGEGCVNGTGDCSPTELAQDDINVWELEVAERMPPGVDADIQVTLGADFDTYAISITWPEAGYDSDLSYNLTAQL